MERKFAVIENNKVVNIIVNVEDEVLENNPDKYIEYTNGWDFTNGIDGGEFLIKPAPPKVPQVPPTVVQDESIS